MDVNITGTVHFTNGGNLTVPLEIRGRSLVMDETMVRVVRRMLLDPVMDGPVYWEVDVDTDYVVWKDDRSRYYMPERIPAGLTLGHLNFIEVRIDGVPAPE